MQDYYILKLAIPKNPLKVCELKDFKGFSQLRVPNFRYLTTKTELLVTYPIRTATAWIQSQVTYPHLKFWTVFQNNSFCAHSRSGYIFIKSQDCRFFSLAEESRIVDLDPEPSGQSDPENCTRSRSDLFDKNWFTFLNIYAKWSSSSRKISF